MEKHKPRCLRSISQGRPDVAEIHKIKLTSGVYWVEIPRAGLYLLCGCPADAVKQMMKKGLIRQKEIDGRIFETGPNAILLSDVLIQNGRFSNLSEFPVLQMLYRQGMILPGHPGNTGAKPMLIGSAEQVQSQMEYIFRGNYGLISEEEITAAGIPAGQAREMMRLKLKFAFGEIKPSEELIDAVAVGDSPVEIINGAMIIRLGFNRFLLRYENEEVAVDLNLGPYEEYELPYHLGYHLIRRGFFSVVHSGEGDGWDINRPCMASILIHQGRVYLIDAGPNILYSLESLGIGVNEIEGVFHTHAHDDHFSGLTTLMRSDHRIKHYSTALVRASVIKKFSALLELDESEFLSFFEVHDLEFDAWNNINGLEVKPIFSPHPLETNILLFRVVGEDGFKTYAHWADIVGLDTLRGMITHDPSEPGVSPEFYDKVKRDYLTPADLKKLDIGGGLIHGSAEDFRADESNKLLLAHTEFALTPAQKEIGSGAPFGTVDELLPAYQDYIRSYAFHFLRSYFPTVPRHQLNLLLNNPVIVFNPKPFWLKSGRKTNSCT